ncbi:MAG: glycerate 2-kinase, partial [Solirubrobacteraceae bacterium]|nr:glycerate 2-kinase [Solirubrobacteraceae bacterium]
MPVLVAPEAFGGDLRAPVVAAAIGRGRERAGWGPPDLSPVAGGGRGTIEVLLPALGGETGDGFALVEEGATAIVEVDEPAATGERLAAAATTGARSSLQKASGATRTGMLCCMAAKEYTTIEADGHELRLSSPSKVYFP